MYFPTINAVCAVASTLLGYKSASRQSRENQRQRDFTDQQNQKARDHQDRVKKEEQNYQDRVREDQRKYDEQVREDLRKYDEQKSQLDRDHQLKMQENAHLNNTELVQFRQKHEIELEKLKAELNEQKAQRAREFSATMQSKKQEHQEKMAKLHFQQSLEIMKNKLEYAKIMEDWGLEITPMQLLEASNLNSPSGIPLTVLMVNTSNPPYSDLDADITTDLRGFIKEQIDPKRYIEFMDGAWRKDRQGGGAAVSQIRSLCRSMPMLILEVQFIRQANGNDEGYFNINFAYWGLDEGTYEYGPFLSKLPCKSFQDNSQIRQFISVYFKLILGICTDAHYIKHYGKPPFFPDHIKPVLDHQEGTSLTEKLIEQYCQALESQKEEKGLLISEWLLEIARSVDYIPSLAVRIADRAVRNRFSI